MNEFMFSNYILPIINFFPSIIYRIHFIFEVVKSTLLIKGCYIAEHLILIQKI